MNKKSKSKSKVRGWAGHKLWFLVGFLIFGFVGIRSAINNEFNGMFINLLIAAAFLVGYIYQIKYNKK